MGLVAALSLLMLVLFLLPPTAGEKITFGGLCIVLNLLYVAFVYCLIRPPATSTPLIGTPQTSINSPSA